MTTLIDDPVSESTSTSTTSLIPHPGPRPKAHKAAAHLKSTKARLGSQGLLVPAEGGVPPEVDLIVDVDLSGLPVHPVGHPQYERALEFRMKVEVTNTVNARKREQLTLKAWTKVYGLLSACCETTHPVLHEEMYELCRLDKRGVPGGYFDGPRSYKLYLASLTGPRTKEDREVYELALKLQRENRLADDCASADFAKKALNFIVYLEPNLSRRFEPDEAGEHIVSLLPKALAADGRRLLKEFKAEGTLGDLRHVARECETVVADAQLARGTKPANHLLT